MRNGSAHSHVNGHPDKCPAAVKIQRLSDELEMLREEVLKTAIKDRRAGELLDDLLAGMVNETRI